MVIYFEKSNTYGSVFSWVISVVLRLLCGESTLNIPSLITFGEICVEGECGPVPFRTIVMLIALISHLAVSLLTDYLFTNHILGLNFDFFGCYKYG